MIIRFYFKAHKDKVNSIFIPSIDSDSSKIFLKLMLVRSRTWSLSSTTSVLDQDYPELWKPYKKLLSPLNFLESKLPLAFQNVIMKTSRLPLVVFTFCLILVSCGKSGHEDQHDHTAEKTNNENELYDEVMKLHDEGMARMDEMYKLKEELKDQIASTPQLVEEKKKDIEAKILKLDSAQKGMMVWMRNFHPEIDSLDAEAYNKYLEAEMEKVQKVKDDIFDAIARARQE